MSELHQKFDALSHHKRYNLAIGDRAKVCVNFDESEGVSGERFWVEITASEEGRYQGIVDNELSYSASHGIYLGDLISFDYRHIYDVVLQSEMADMKSKADKEMGRPEYKNESLKAAGENEPWRNADEKQS
jgi:hypothetical protein